VRLKWEKIEVIKLSGLGFQTIWPSFVRISFRVSKKQTILLVQEKNNQTNLRGFSTSTLCIISFEQDYALDF
jgi:hypothetical protein